jgi:AraC family transcriptional regulator
MAATATAEARTDCLRFYYHLGEVQGEQQPHEHDTHQVIVTLGGGGDVFWWTARDGRSHMKARDGRVIVNPAGEPHAAHWCGAWDCIGFYLAAHVTDAVANDIGISSAVRPVYNGVDHAIYGLARTVLHELHAQPFACSLYADAAARFLAMRLLRSEKNMENVARNARTLSGNKMRALSGYVRENIDSDLSVAALAACIDLRPYDFSRRFKVTTGMTPYEYVTRERLEVVKRLLRETNLSIADIAYRSGFSSQAHLAMRFKQVVGITPSRYRSS